MYKDIYRKRGKRVSIFIGIFLIVVNLLVMVYISNSLENANKEHIFSLMKKNDKILTLAINEDMNTINGYSKLISDTHMKYIIDNVDISEYSYDESIHEEILLSNTDGKAISLTNQNIVDVSKSDYFKEALKGKHSINKSYLNSEPISDTIVYTSPIVIKNKVEGAIIVRTNLGNLVKNLDLELVDNKTCIYITKGNGDIISRFTYHDDVNESDNIYKMYNIKDDKFLGKDYDIFSKQYDSGKMYLSYKKIDGIDDSYIVKSVPEEAIFGSKSKVITAFFCIMFIQLSVYIFYIIYSHKKEKESIQILKEIAYKDNLSGIYNFNRFKDKAYEILNYSDENYAIIKVNIINFKYINGQFGHTVGDEVLKYISNILKQSILTGEICARGNNDKFILMLKYKNDEDIINRLRDIEYLINVYRVNKYTNKRIECSYYVYNIKENDKSKRIDDILDDLSIYKSIFDKDSYSSDIKIKFYDDDIKNKLIKDKKLQDDMKKGIDNEEFRLYVQPKYNIKDKCIQGAEVLVRWEKEGTMIYPDEFIPLFEQNRSIIDLDLYIFETSCKYIRKWINKNINVVPMAINVSKVTLYSDGFSRKISRLIEIYNINPSLLEIEITESVDYENVDLLIEKVLKLKEIGVSVSIDDFGSGYSSFNMLTDVPIDVLKIDKEFLRYNKMDKNNEIIVKSIVSMASSLGLKVVAEGVETKEQLKFLDDIDCDMAQGYLLDRPMDIKEFEKRLSL